MDENHINEINVVHRQNSNFEKLYNEVDVEFAKITSYDGSYLPSGFQKKRFRQNCKY